MNAPFPFALPGGLQVVADLVAAVASRDECAMLVGEAEAVAAVLDQAVRALPRHRVRCVRVSTSPAGALVSSGLVAQVAGRPDAGALTDADLQAGFLALTDPGEGYDRVVLLVEGAQALSPPALRYLQLVCRSGPRLRLVLAGGPGLHAVLAGAEFARLRRLFTCRLDLSGPAADGPPSPFSAASAAPGWDAAGWDRPGRDAPPEAPVRRRIDLRGVAELALVASLALAVWVTWQEDAPAPPGIALQAHVPVEGGAKDALAVQVQAVWQQETAPIRPGASEVDDAPGRAGHAFVERVRAEAEPPLAPGPAALSVQDAPTDADADALRQARTPAAADAEPSASPPPRNPALAGAVAGGPGVESPVHPHPVAPPPPEGGVTAGLTTPKPGLPAVAAVPLGVLPMARGSADVMADALVAATAPAGGADERRCRDAVLGLLLGQVASDADKRFLRGGCHVE